MSLKTALKYVSLGTGFMVKTGGHHIKPGDVLVTDRPPGPPWRLYDEKRDGPIRRPPSFVLIHDKGDDDSD